MKTQSFPSALAVALLAVAPAGSASAVLPFLKKGDLKEVPASEELTRQDNDARAMLDEAMAAKAGGKPDKAEDALKTVIERYPLTKTAATAQFEMGKLREEQGKPLKAFEEYQKFIDNHRESELYGEVVRRQFELATLAMNGKVSNFFGMLPSKAQPSRVIELYTQVAQNAPRSTYAPMSIFNIGLLEKEAGKDEAAIAAFQRILDDYADDPKAKEAALEVIAIREGRRTRDDSQIRQRQLEMEKFLSDYASDPRSQDMRQKVTALEESDASKKFDTAKFYERKGNLRAAAIYYQGIPPGTTRHADAQKRLGELRAMDPNLVLAPSAPRSRVVAEERTVDRPDYNGPPPPRLESPSKPQMRTSAEDVLPIAVP